MSEQDVLNPAGGNLPPIPILTAAKALFESFLDNRLGIQVEPILPWRRQMNQVTCQDPCQADLLQLQDIALTLTHKALYIFPLLQFEGDRGELL